MFYVLLRYFKYVDEKLHHGDAQLDSQPWEINFLEKYQLMAIYIYIYARIDYVLKV